jgi:predicted enzyme related to lactoylglutathione lyase
MVTQRTYPHGVPCWVEIETRDVDATAAFYGELFGWRFVEQPARGGARYVVASLDGTDGTAVAAVAGVTGLDTVRWVTSVAVDDVDAAAGRVVDLGGAVLEPPADVGPADLPAGRAATVRDPQGVESRLWKAGSRPGAQRVNEPGTWNFSNVLTPDPATAIAFYGALLGWEVDPDLAAGMARVPGYGDHLARTSDPGIHERQEGFAPPGFADAVAGVVPDDGPARWSVAFAVADRDAAVAAARDAGATVLGTTEDPWARHATVRDPQGAVLTLSEFAPQA